MERENRSSGHHHRNNNGGKINNRSMSDADSQTSQLDEFHSPLRYDSPLRSDDPFPLPPPPPPPDDSRAIVSLDKNHYSPYRSPPLRKQPPPPKALSPVLAFNRAVREEAATGVHKLGPAGVGEDGVGEVAAEDGGVGGERRSRAAVTSILRRPRSDVTLEKAALGFRVSELILSLISFSVMVSDKTQGWSGDSFDRYKEYRYCVAVNVIAFAYSGFQALGLTYYLIHGRHLLSYYLRYHFDFLMDQILAYLLISASSSAATRVDDWVSNWGKDEFTEKASASIGMSFLAFTAFALSSLLSGYNLCTQNSV